MRWFAVAMVAVVSCGFKLDNAEDKVFYGHEARAAIEAFGFTNVKITGPALYGCGRDYSLADEFTGVGPRGHKVEGVVCGGIIVKGWSVKIWKVEPPKAGDEKACAALRASGKECE